MTAGTACAECRSLMGGYVLHALDSDETDIVRDHLASCGECARELQALEGLPVLLDAAGVPDVPAQPPAELEEAVLDSFAREHRGRTRPPSNGAFWDRARRLRRWLSRPIPAALAGGVAAALVAVALTIALDPNGSHDDGLYHADLRPISAAAGGSGYATLETTVTGTQVKLQLKGMPVGDDVYELWCVADDGSTVSAGTFRVDADGSADVRLTAAARLGEYRRLTVERRESASGESGARQRVLAGQIGC